MDIIILGFLVIIFSVQLISRKTRSDFYRSGFFGLTIFISAAIIIFGLAGYYSWAQYKLWQGNEIGKFFLPPYRNLDYFVFFIRTRFFNQYLLSLIVGIIFLAATRYLNKRFGERFFELIEPYLLATAIFSVGHPAWLVYLFVLLISALILSFVSSHLSFVKSERLSFYYLWLPTAFLTIIISKWLSVLPWWQLLKL
ncbi:MAG: hypothetical protein HZB99_00850 [Candidatus Harrisonbacteria bacterium]|nr:hypothetical protein [Candidatus Harrisonbacteria bacterium]